MSIARYLCAASKGRGPDDVRVGVRVVTVSESEHAAGLVAALEAVGVRAAVLPRALPATRGPS